MTQVTVPHSATLEDSRQLIALLERYAPQSALAHDALVKHRYLHHHLENHQHASEQALAAWRASLTRRWRCEIEGQRVYNQTIQELQHHFARTSLEYQAMVGDGNGPITAEDLLVHMQRMYAALLMLPQMPLALRGCVDRLEQMQADLATALDETQARERERRQAMAERRMTNDACARAIAETKRLLEEHLPVSPPGEVSFRMVEAPAGNPLNGGINLR
jgi:hypothetical protein